MDWLGLTATTTKVIGWIFVALAIVLLGILIWYLVKNANFQKDDHIKNEEKNAKKFEEVEQNNIQKKESADKQDEVPPKPSVAKKKTATPKKKTTTKKTTAKITSTKTKSKQ